jgi:hypothetical protein
MNKPVAASAGKPAGRPIPQTATVRAVASDRKPTGPLTYKIESGADVWPRLPGAATKAQKSRSA